MTKEDLILVQQLIDLNRKKWLLEQRIENYWKQSSHSSYTEQCLQRELGEVENQIENFNCLYGDK